MGTDPACMFKSVWGAYAASDDSLQPAVGLGVKLARLANEVWLVIFAHGRQVKCTMSVDCIIFPSGKRKSGFKVNIGVQALHVVSTFFNWFMLNVTVFQSSS